MFFVYSIIARDEGRGQASMELLQKEGLSPKFHQLDITDNNSVATIKDFLVKTYGGLDILVNNAGIAYKVSVNPLPLGIF